MPWMFTNFLLKCTILSDFHIPNSSKSCRNSLIVAMSTLSISRVSVIVNMDKQVKWSTLNQIFQGQLQFKSKREEKMFIGFAFILFLSVIDRQIVIPEYSYLIFLYCFFFLVLLLFSAKENNGFQDLFSFKIYSSSIYILLM